MKAVSPELMGSPPDLLLPVLVLFGTVLFLGASVLLPLLSRKRPPSPFL